MGLGLGLSLWGSTVGHPSNCWASCCLSDLISGVTPSSSKCPKDNLWDYLSGLFCKLDVILVAHAVVSMC